jgi:hypothetical protein
MTNFSNPTLESTYTNVLSELKAAVASVAAMDFTSDTNVPTSTIRYNRTSKQLEEWGGASWTAKEIALLADGCVATAKVAADAVTDAKIRLASAGYLRSRNNANNADLSLLRSDASDNTVLNGASGKSILFANAGTSQWAIGTSLLPQQTSLDIGATGLPVSRLYTKDIDGGAGSNLGLSAQGNYWIWLSTNGAARWAITNTGVLKPDSALDFGATAKRVNNIYCNGVDVNGSVLLPNNTSYQGKNTGGTALNMLKVDNYNTVVLSGGDNGLHINPTANGDTTNILYVTSNAAINFNGTCIYVGAWTPGTPGGYLKVFVNGGNHYIPWY